jgi:glycosyltransferase involved in cell wall biosynthesis
MKVVHALGWYFPESVGGTEVYVERLCSALAQRGVELTVMAPAEDGEEARYEHAGVTVVRYAVPPHDPRKSGGARHARFDRFVELLQGERADIFHLHSLTYGCSGQHALAARALGLRVFATVHTPSLLCMRGTMVRMGVEACDGRVDPAQCVPCYAQSRGVPELLARAGAPLLRALPEDRMRASTKLGTLRALPRLVHERAQALHALLAASERVVVVCDWLRRALLENGAPAEQLVLLRQAVDAPAVLPPRRVRGAHDPLRIGFFGRADAVKGLDTLVDAVQRVPTSVRVELLCHAAANSDSERALLEAVRARTAGDARFVFASVLAPQQVSGAMRGCDVVAVPSRWLETGPLVALEAMALGVPVLGSRLGGLCEVVEPGATGYLEPPGDAAAFAARIERIARGEDALDPTRATLHVPSTLELADAMLALYSR